jgi:DNA-directed RNA polymerase specialized sigma24 family protein
MSLRESREERHQDAGDSVAALWDEFVRSAYLLTGSRAEAEELAARALLRGGRGRRRPDATLVPAKAARRRLVRLAVSRWGRWTALVGRLVVPRPSRGADGHPARDQSLPPLVLACLRLPLRERAALVLRYGSGLSEVDAADALGVEVAEVERLAARGLERLDDRVGRVGSSADAVLELDLGEQ